MAARGPVSYTLYATCLAVASACHSRFVRFPNHFVTAESGTNPTKKSWKQQALPALPPAVRLAVDPSSQACLTLAGAHSQRNQRQGHAARATPTHLVRPSEALQPSPSLRLQSADGPYGLIKTEFEHRPNMASNLQCQL